MKGPTIVTMVLSLQLLMVIGALAGDDFGIGTFESIIKNNPERLCYYITCHESIAKEKCPNGTSYMEGVAQFGCCGSCVRFKQDQQIHCTGSIDPQFGGGYQEETSLLALRNSLIGHHISDTLLPNKNILESSWCDFNLQCYQKQTKCITYSPESNCNIVRDAYLSATNDAEPHPEDNPGSAKYVKYRDDYRWEPTCTTSGEYIEKQCKGPIDEQRCVCVDPRGVRLYGAAFFFQKELFNTMNCKCSRKVWERTQAGESSVTLHCAENGNYERLQCENGWCYCVDPETATIYGPNMPETAMRLLPCYKASLVGDQYLRKCESEFHSFTVLKDLLKSKGVQPPSTALTCDPDGSYSPIQNNGYNDACFDKYRHQVGAGVAGGGCQCERDKLILTTVGIIPSCDSGQSGKYSLIQTRGLDGFCVDSDGIRNSPRVLPDYWDTLDCLLAVSCQNGYATSCPLACDNCPIEAYSSYEPPE